MHTDGTLTRHTGADASGAHRLCWLMALLRAQGRAAPSGG